eukprot:IDg23776t1
MSKLTACHPRPRATTLAQIGASCPLPHRHPRQRHRRTTSGRSYRGPQNLDHHMHLVPLPRRHPELNYPLYPHHHASLSPLRADISPRSHASFLQNKLKKIRLVALSAASTRRRAQSRPQKGVHCPYRSHRSNAFRRLSPAGLQHARLRKSSLLPAKRAARCSTAWANDNSTTPLPSISVRSGSTTLNLPSAVLRVAGLRIAQKTSNETYKVVLTVISL